MNLLAILLISTLTYSSSNDCNSVQTESGECCHFPFMYGGQTYYECTSDGRSQQWCSLTYSYDQDGQWGNCRDCKTVQTEEGGCCYFPFVYNGQTYHQCTSDDWTQPWCSPTVNYNQDGQWGNCAGLGDYVLQNMHHTVFFGRNIIVGVVLVIMLAIPCYWISRVNNVDNV